MKIPKKVKSGCLEYKVEYFKFAEDKWKQKEGARDLWGYCDHDTETIYLKKGMRPARKLEVFLHESFHMIEESWDISLGEKRVNLLGMAMCDFLKRNKIDFND